MLDLISKVVAAILAVFSTFFVSKKILRNKDKVFTLKNIGMFIVFLVIIIGVYNVNYSPFASLIFYLSMVLVYKVILKVDLSKAIITVGLSFLIYFFADLIVGIIMSLLFGAVEMRESAYIFIISNLLVSSMTILFFIIPPIKTRTRLFVERLDYNKRYDKILFLVLMFTVLTLILYNVATAAKVSNSYLIDVIIMFIFFLLIFIFVNEKNNKDKLNDEYDRLMEYVENFENWIEDEQLNRHEYKNQLSVIKGMVRSNKKATKYIDDIIKDDIYVEDFWVNEIKYLPSGGIKGLLYYKLILTKKASIDICLSVSRDTKNFIKDVSNAELKNIYRLLGIYLDNAIEAARESVNKVISLEIYPMNSKLMIVISNTYNGSVNIKKIKKKGYTTKGVGHGNGLYYADKIIKKSSILSSDSSIINNYYVQKLMITKKEV